MLENPTNVFGIVEIGVTLQNFVPVVYGMRVQTVSVQQD